MSGEWTDDEGNSLGDWQEITREEFDRLNHPGLMVFSTLTDPGGAFGIRQVYTAWGQQGADAPLIDIRDFKGEDGKTERQICRKFVPVSGLPPVDPEVLDRAVEEGRESVRTGMHVNTTQGYQEQEFRAIAAAAYRQGREDGQKELEARVEAAAEAFAGQRDRANWNDPFREGKTAGFRAALAAMLDPEGVAKDVSR